MHHFMIILSAPRTFWWPICRFLQGFLLLDCNQSSCIFNPFTGVHPDEHVIHVEYYFSLRGNAWKEIEPPYLSYEGCSDRFVSDFGLFFNGVIHWLASPQDVLTERDFSDISLPVNFVYASFKLCFVRVIGELLNLCAVMNNHFLEIWVMKEYKVHLS